MLPFHFFELQYSILTLYPLLLVNTKLYSLIPTKKVSFGVLTEKLFKTLMWVNTIKAGINLFFHLNQLQNSTR